MREARARNLDIIRDGEYGWDRNERTVFLTAYTYTFGRLAAMSPIGT